MKVVDPTLNEKIAMTHAGEMGGEFIEECQQADMSLWSAEQWDAFIATICGAYVDSLVQQATDATAALRRVQTA